MGASDLDPTRGTVAAAAPAATGRGGDRRHRRRRSLLRFFVSAARSVIIVLLLFSFVFLLSTVAFVVISTVRLLRLVLLFVNVLRSCIWGRPLVVQQHSPNESIHSERGVGVFLYNERDGGAYGIPTLALSERDFILNYDAEVAAHTALGIPVTPPPEEGLCDGDGDAVYGRATYTPVPMEADPSPCQSSPLPEPTTPSRREDADSAGGGGAGSGGGGGGG